jgi:cytochrome c biogenesis protein CcdA
VFQSFIQSRTPEKVLFLILLLFTTQFQIEFFKNLDILSTFVRFFQKTTRKVDNFFEFTLSSSFGWTPLLLPLGFLGAQKMMANYHYVRWD